MHTHIEYIQKAIFAILFMASINTTGILAQPSATQKDMSNEAITAKVDEFLSSRDKKNEPGGAVGVIKDGRLVYKRGLGLANLDYDVPNDPTTTRFNLASASKPFTAFCIMLLAQQGKLLLEDDIRKYVPELPDYGHTITIRHLLDHTSGIREYQALVFFGGQSPDGSINDKDVLKLLARQKNISFKPGDKYQYSNSGYHLLGNIVARVSGKSLRAFADDNIFKPLGMKNTMYFDDRQEIVKNRASGYIAEPGERVKARASLFHLVGGGGVLSTIEDLSLWEQNFHEPKVGTPEMIKVMTTPGSLNNGEKLKYSFGLFHNTYKGVPVIRHSGNMSGYRAQIVSFPSEKFSVIMLSNNSAVIPSSIAEKLADIYLDGRLKPAPSSENVPASQSQPAGNTLSETGAARYAGIYAHAASGRVFKLSVKDGKLINNGIFPNDVPVTVAAENRLFVVSGNGKAELHPIVDKSGVVSEIHAPTNGGKPDVFVRVNPPADSPETLAEYAGTYYSEEFDGNHILKVKGNGLVLQIGDNFEAPFMARAADIFTGGGNQVRLTITRDAKGKINGLIFNSEVDGRDVKGVIFTRR
jgi:CubicO group peptidase (beta-lactamase class C family)